MIVNTHTAILSSMKFEDPVLDAQQAFRTILTAMAYPGRIVTLHRPNAFPEGLHQAAWAVLLTLVDESVHFWTDLPEDHEAQRAVEFFCRPQKVSDAQEAELLLITQPDNFSGPYLFRVGTETEPHLGATLIMQMTCLTNAGATDAAESLSFTGPGVPDVAKIWVNGCPAEFWEWRKRLEAVYPRGVDLLLTHGPSLVAIPRSLIITREKGDLCTSR